MQVNDLADSFKRSLAEMENLRQRTARQIENAQKFAVEVRRHRQLAGRLCCTRRHLLRPQPLAAPAAACCRCRWLRL